jgi:DNA/RNA endonuclease YhcR with UshA esterase domain
MKRQFVAAMAVLALVSVARAEEAAKPEKSAIQASDKAALDAAKDKEATVEGTVSEAAWSKSGKVMVIRFEGADESGFSAVVFQRSQDAFDKALDGDATKALKGAKVKVTGTVKTFRDKPEIVLNKPSQLVVEEKGKGEEKPAAAGAAEEK